METVSYTNRFALPAGLFLLALLSLAVSFHHAPTVEIVVEAMVVLLTAPVRSLWYLPNARGPIPPPLLIVLFSLLPLVLLPAYLFKPRTATCLLTIVGAVLWIVSGGLMLAILFLD